MCVILKQIPIVQTSYEITENKNITVSYTHLDVYKRQEYTVPEKCHFYLDVGLS